MSDPIKYVFYWANPSNWFNTNGFCIYTYQQVEDFIKINKQVKFIEMGPETAMTDLSYRMYKIMESDIILDNEYIGNNDVRYNSHHHTDS